TLGIRFAVEAPFAMAGLTPTASAPASLATGANGSVWAASNLTAKNAAGFSTQYARVTQISATGALGTDLLFTILPRGAACALPPQLPSTTIGPIADAGDGLILVLQNAPADRRFVVTKIDYTGALKWSARVEMDLGGQDPIPKRALAASGGAVVVG